MTGQSKRKGMTHSCHQHIVLQDILQFGINAYATNAKNDAPDSRFYVFVVIMDDFINIRQGHYTRTGAIIWFPSAVKGPWWKWANQAKCIS